MRDTVVHGDAGRKGDACSFDHPKFPIQISLKSIYQEQQFNVPFVTFTPFTDLLYTALVPCSISSSPLTQSSRMFAPATLSSTSFFITLCTMSAALCNKLASRNRQYSSLSLSDPNLFIFDGIDLYVFRSEVSSFSKVEGNHKRTLYLVRSASAVERGVSTTGFASALDISLLFVDVQMWR